MPVVAMREEEWHAVLGAASTSALATVAGFLTGTEWLLFGAALGSTTVLLLGLYVNKPGNARDSDD